MAKKINIYQYIRKAKKKRPGIHAKSKSSNLKSSRNYVKQYYIFYF